jgi:peptidoglycan/LPS O-acetylase OafA/YrhL
MAEQSTPRPDIPSLTGMRFIAAFLVVVAHTSSYFVAAQPAWLDFAWRTCAALGLTTFFVLSGFVIHYNYGSVIAAKGAPAVRSFLVARFARLYPLYILTLLIGVALSPSIIREETFRRIWVWRYLTMTQDWTPTLVDGQLLTALYLGWAWSISAEVALYLFYLPAAVRLDGLQAGAALRALLVLSVAGFIFVAGYALGVWLNGLPHPDLDWWLAFSPLSRLPEFFLGALTAQLYLAGPALKDHEAARAQWIGLVGLIWVVGVFVACFRYPNFQTAFSFAPSTAMIVFFLVSRRSRAAALLGGSVMVALGDASYSIYMLHAFGLGYVMRQTPYVPGVLRIALAWGATALLSVVIYRYFEAPARRFIRRFGAGKRRALS